MGVEVEAGQAGVAAAKEVKFSDEARTKVRP